MMIIQHWQCLDQTKKTSPHLSCLDCSYYQEKSSPALNPVQSVMESVLASSSPCPRTPLSRISMNHDGSTGLPKELPFPDCFSIQVEAAIQNNNVLPVRLKLINDISHFYYGICKHPRQGDYKRIARKACDRFPELKDANVERYWVSDV